MTDLCFDVVHETNDSLFHSLGDCWLCDDGLRVIGDVISDTLTTLT